MFRIITVLENIIKPLRAWGLPRNADIEITNLCQLRCDMCPRTGFEKDRPLGKMSLEQFRRILNEIRDIPCLSFSGNGEATLHPQFMELFHLAQKAEKKITMSTNGLALGKFSDGELKEIVNGFQSIDISMDSPYKEKYEAIRNGASFDELIKGIRRLTEIEQGGGRVSMHLVYLDQTRSELEDMMALAKEIGVNKISIGKLMHYQGSGVREKMAINGADIRELKLRAGEKSLEMVFGFFEDFSLAKRAIGCNWPWRYVFISYEGVVTPCCSLKDPTEINLGNIFKDDFRTIWQGERYRRLRQSIKGKDFPPYCRAVKCWHLDKN